MSEETELLIKPITENDIIESIAKQKNNKSPRTDGFSGEYYTVFVNELAPILCSNSIQLCTEIRRPPKFMVRWPFMAILPVIHKEGKDPLQCTSYCPISLLCVDYKILTSIMAARIQKNIKKLIQPEQTGFILGRQGTNNIRRALNLQTMATRDKPSMLLSVQAEKAFDQVDWLFLRRTLIEMSFGKDFVT